ncbi:LysR family transcriptional regulator [Henriciella marina]|uniref:LysR family transcriptional regulator n=1 Tax=Henriciella marina TaxID=453851 RepID=UPI00035C994E|nr:LysR family transcriptional regulator [Henriciella marina]
MNWDDLKLLLEISRHSKLSDAAARTGLDATTVGRRLRRLEADLGLSLFERTRRGHVLTSAGEEIVAKAEAIEQSALEIYAQADTGGMEASGRVRLGVTEGLANSLIAPTLAGFRDKYPAIALDLIAMSGFASVPKREADMAIMLARPTSGRLKVRKLSDYALYLFASPDYLARRGTPRTPQNLSDHTLIGYVDDLIYSPQLRYHAEIAPDLSLQYCSPSIIAQLQMARAGLGIAVLPNFMAARDKALQPVLKDKVRVQRSFWLSLHEDLAPLARIRALSDFLAELFETNRDLVLPSEL